MHSKIEAVQAILDARADYLLIVKQNQPSLSDCLLERLIR